MAITLTVLPVTPQAGLTSIVATGLTSVQVSPPGGINGGFISNPLNPADEGVGPEPLYVDLVGSCQPIAGVLYAGGTITALQPGDSFSLIPGQITPVYVNATTSGHRFTIIIW
jgi:hypothetical protein